MAVVHTLADLLLNFAIVCLKYAILNPNSLQCLHDRGLEINTSNILAMWDTDEQYIIDY